MPSKTRALRWASWALWWASWALWWAAMPSEETRALRVVIPSGLNPGT
jgi:hypothetical protein